MKKEKEYEVTLYLQNLVYDDRGMRLDNNYESYEAPDYPTSVAAVDIEDAKAQLKQIVLDELAYWEALTDDLDPEEGYVPTEMPGGVEWCNSVSGCLCDGDVEVWDVEFVGKSRTIIPAA